MGDWQRTDRKMDELTARLNAAQAQLEEAKALLRRCERICFRVMELEMSGEIRAFLARTEAKL